MSNYLIERLPIIEEMFILLEYNISNDFMYNDLVKNKIGIELCQGKIDEAYILEKLEDLDIDGYILMYNNKYYGIMLYYIYDNSIELKLIGVKRDEYTIGLPLGQYMLYILEKKAKDMNIYNLKAESLKNIVDFYIDNGWVFINQEDEEEYYLQEYNDKEKDDNSMDIDVDENKIEEEELNIYEIEKKLKKENSIIPIQMDIDDENDNYIDKNKIKKDIDNIFNSKNYFMNLDKKIKKLFSKFYS